MAAVTSDGYALTPEAATPWSAANTTAAGRRTAGRPVPCQAASHPASSSSLARRPGRAQDPPGPLGHGGRGLQVGPGHPGQQVGHLPVQAGVVSHRRLRARPAGRPGGRPAGDQQQGLVGGGRPDGVDLAEQVAVAAAQGVGGHDAGADLVADGHRRRRPGRGRAAADRASSPTRRSSRPCSMRFDTHRVRQSTSTAASPAARQGGRQVARRLDRRQRPGRSALWRGMRSAISASLAAPAPRR